jgi:hypothetical protein
MSLVVRVAPFRHYGGRALEVVIEGRQLHHWESKTIDRMIAVDKDDQALKPFHILSLNFHYANSFGTMDPPSPPIEMKESERCELWFNLYSNDQIFTSCSSRSKR